MAGSVNKCIILGNLTRDPEIRSAGDRKVANLTVATSEVWRDKNSGERKEKSEFHRVTIWSEGLVKVAENYLKKGAKVYIEGKLQTRDYEKDGVKKYVTEICLQGYDATLTMLDGPKQNAEPVNTNDEPRRNPPPKSGGLFNKTLDDEIPF